jgi:cystathionine beta-lyase/cystathionine gamma-synthase
VTWLFCSLSVLVVLGSLLLIISDSSRVLDAMHTQNPDLARQGVGDDLIRLSVGIEHVDDLMHDLIAMLVNATHSRSRPVQ